VGGGGRVEPKRKKNIYVTIQRERKKGPPSARARPILRGQKNSEQGKTEANYGSPASGEEKGHPIMGPKRKISTGRQN